MIERWRTIEEFPDYQVSNLGRITRKHSAKNNHKTKKVLRPGCSNVRNPRPTVVLYKEGKPHTRSVSRIVLFTFKGKPKRENQKECNHKDGNRKNNSISNLEWSSGTENVQHALHTGLRKNQARGERIRGSILKESDVVLIKRMLRENERQTDIAKHFGVDKCTIHDIKENKTWKHLN
jgi:hypothetical protein